MISSNSDPNQMFDLFYIKLSGIIDAHIPIKKLSKQELKIKYKPWITRAIRVSIQEKNRIYKKYLKTKSAYYHAKFKLYRNKINHYSRNYYRKESAAVTYKVENPQPIILKLLIIHCMY